MTSLKTYPSALNVFFSWNSLGMTEWISVNVIYGRLSTEKMYLDQVLYNLLEAVWKAFFCGCCILVHHEIVRALLWAGNSHSSQSGEGNLKGGEHARLLWYLNAIREFWVKIDNGCRLTRNKLFYKTRRINLLVDTRIRVILRVVELRNPGCIIPPCRSLQIRWTVLGISYFSHLELGSLCPE